MRSALRPIPLHHLVPNRVHSTSKYSYPPQPTHWKPLPFPPTPSAPRFPLPP
ncbi:MAG: hypothetical protein ACK5UT_11545, partial [Acidobacteriota bacterium]